MSKHAWLAMTPEEYERLGLKKGVPELWEDGIRTENFVTGNYEWWYFDSKLDDGSNLVIIFFTCPITTICRHFEPHATLDLTRPDGTSISVKIENFDDCFWSRDKCEVRMNESYFIYNNGQYEIHFVKDDLEVDVVLKGNVRPWRPQTGHILFDNKDYFAWLPSVPEGHVEVNFKTKEDVVKYTGTGYHDHNWGNIPMFFLMHHWYWGRARIGEYQAVTSYITAAKKYSYDTTPVFMLAKNGEILADEPEKYLTYSEEDYFFEERTGKHVANRLIYDYDDGKQHYKITYEREYDTEVKGMKDLVSGLQYWGVKLLGLDGSYHRMGGTAKLERYEGDEVVETVVAPALWEQMYFGKDRM